MQLTVPSLPIAIPRVASRQDVEAERRKRIRVSLAAYAYEAGFTPIMDDFAYDALAKEVCPAICTGHAELDAFFRTSFSPDTGMWVHSHPEYTKLADLYDKLVRTNAFS